MGLGLLHVGADHRGAASHRLGEWPPRTALPPPPAGRQPGARPAGQPPGTASFGLAAVHPAPPGEKGTPVTP
jgi:hypothetical protein